MEMTNVGNLLELRRIYSRGITGKGITTAVLDTGIYAHPDFFIPQNKILYFQDFVRNRRGPFDDNGHGTHVSGIIASGGRFGDGSGIGVAPESSIVMLKVLERDGSGKIKNMIKGMEWICMNHKKYGIRIVNISVGMPVKNIENPDEDILVKKVEELWNAGLVVVVAAGNDGPAPHTITSPGTSRKVITVGTGTEAGGEYSGQGPVLGCCVCKPDIIAPATNILSCDNHGKSYKKRSGTSMATPIVSGTIALLLSNEPWLSNRDVKIRLMQNAVDCGMAKSRQGWGLLNPEGMLRIK